MSLKEEFLKWVSHKTPAPRLVIDDLLTATLEETIAGVERTTLNGNDFNKVASKEQLFNDIMYYWVKTTENVLAGPNILHKDLKMPLSDSAKQDVIVKLKNIQRVCLDFV